jgi:hypothetical protein
MYQVMNFTIDVSEQCVEGEMARRPETYQKYVEAAKKADVRQVVSDHRRTTLRMRNQSMGVFVACMHVLLMNSTQEI